MALAQLGKDFQSGEEANLELGHSWMELHSWMALHSWMVLHSWVVLHSWMALHSWMERHSWRRGHHSHLANIWIEPGIGMLPIPPPRTGFPGWGRGWGRFCLCSQLDYTGQHLDCPSCSRAEGSVPSLLINQPIEPLHFLSRAIKMQ